jgi:hypothetical protein
MCSSICAAERASLAVAWAQIKSSRQEMSSIPTNQRKRTVWPMTVEKTGGGRGQVERQDQKLVELPLPLESQVARGIGVHRDMMVGTRNVSSATEPGRLEEGPALALERVHVERLVWEVLIHMATVPNQVLLPRAVICDPQGENAEQALASAGGHCSQTAIAAETNSGAVNADFVFGNRQGAGGPMASSHSRRYPPANMERVSAHTVPTLRMVATQ